MRIQPTTGWTGAAGAGQTGSKPEGDFDARLKEASQEFESLFINQMLQSMRRSVPQSKLFGDQSQERMFREMLDTEMARGMAAGGGMGIGKAIYESMSGSLPAKAAEHAAVEKGTGNED